MWKKSSAHGKNLSMFLLVFLQLCSIEKQGTRSRAKHECVLLARILLLHGLIEVRGLPNIYSVKSGTKV